MSTNVPQYPLEVGEQYRTELGAYTVLNIEDTKAKIKYEDGQQQTISLDLLARIWERIQLEEEIAAQRRAKRKSARSNGSRSRSSYGRDFEGLTEGDFGDDLTGTSWRRREELGGLLAEKLSGASGETFESHAVPRRPQVHIVYPNHYDQKLHVAKFLFDLSGEDAFFGFYIEKSDEPMDESWDWLRFVPALAEDKNLHARTLVAMQHSDLCWTIDTEALDERYVVAEEESLFLQSEPSKVDDGERTPIDWDGFVALLNDIPDDSWCNLYLATRMEDTRAIELGVDLASEVSGVYSALMPLYDVAVQKQ